MFFRTLPIFSILFLVVLASLCGCAPHGLSSNSSQNSSNSDDHQAPQPDQPDAYAPLSWESSVAQGAKWSLMIYDIIQTEQTSLLTTSVQDISIFCPRYDTLSDVQKTNFWGQLIAAMAQFESAWKPATRYVETTMGKDAVTGEQIASEGLLQLSYQDTKYTPGYCNFDWSKDKALNAVNPEDPKKTIFDPYKNLRCGLAILAKQIRSKKAIAVDNGAYWSVIKIGSSHQKIDKIAAFTKSLSFCQ